MLNKVVDTTIIEANLGRLYALWLREFKVFLRERSRLIASTFTPVLWLFVIGSGFGSTHPYRKFDFLKSVMVAPVSRDTVFIGKTLGGMTNSLVQAAILLVIGIAIGINLNALSLIQTIAIVLLLSFALTSVGLAIGSYIESLEGFQLIISFVVFPLFFLSGALFPLKNLPGWLFVLTTIDPATYAVDALRNAIIGTSTYSFAVDAGILVVFTITFAIFGSYSFRRMKAV